MPRVLETKSQRSAASQDSYRKANADTKPPQMTLVGNVKDKCAILVDDMAGP